jgi:hypothetical protein
MNEIWSAMSANLPLRNTESGPQARRFMEHRWGQRVSLRVAAHLATPAGAGGAAVLRDASISGGLLDTDLDLPVHTRLSVVFQVGNGAASRAVEVPACVTRIARRGVGVEWRDMASPPILALLRDTGAELAHLTARDRAFS